MVMNNYYFTFGQNHTLLDGYPMCDHWIHVKAFDYSRAREVFIKEFASQYLEANDKWGFQYDDSNFHPEYFPKGMYIFIADIHADKQLWWGYVNINGSIYVKRFYDLRDLQEARQSQFVKRVYGPFEVVNADEALEIIKKEHYQD
jgi:hypothetical protein